MIGSTASYGAGGSDVLITRLSSTGKVVWAKTFGWSGDEEGYSIQENRYGDFILVGYTASLSVSDAQNILLAKLSAEGELIWVKGIYGVDAYGLSLQITTDGGFVFVGRTVRDGTGFADALIAKWGEDEHFAWAKRLGGASSVEVGYGIQEMADGSYEVIGQTTGFGASDGNVFVARLNTTGGIEGCDIIHTFSPNITDVTYSISMSSITMHSSDVPSTALAAIHPTQTDVTQALQESVSEVCEASEHIPVVQRTTEKATTPASTKPKEGQFVETFFELFGGSNNDWGYATQVVADGGLILVGVTQSYRTGDMDILVTKMDSNGLLQWARTLGSTGDEHGYSIQPTLDGGFVLVGRTYSYDVTGDVLVARLDSEGVLQWYSVWGGLSSDGGYELHTNGSGGFVLSGWTESYGAGSEDVLILQCDIDGSVLWAQALGGEGKEEGAAIKVMSDGSLAITGYTTSFGAGAEDVLVAAWNGEGSVRWTRVLGGLEDDVGYGIQEMVDGSWVVVGGTQSYGAGDWDALVLKLDSDGSLRWARTLGGSGDDEAWDLVATRDGGVVLAGRTYSYGSVEGDVLVAKLDGDGELIWARAFGGSRNDGAYDIGKNDDGGFLLSGWTSSYDVNSFDVLLAGLNEMGWIENCSAIRAIDPTVGDITAAINYSVVSPMVQNVTTQTVLASGLTQTDVTAQLQSSMNRVCGVFEPELMSTTLPMKEETQTGKISPSIATSMPTTTDNDFLRVGSNSDENRVGIIVGSVVGTLAVVSALVATFFVLFKKRKKKFAIEHSNDFSDTHRMQPVSTMGVELIDSHRDTDVGIKPRLLRVWRGKKTPPGQMPVYEPIAAKEEGCAPGFIARSSSGKTCMIKMGWPHDQDEIHLSETLTTVRRQRHRRSEFTAVREKIAADFYAILGFGHFYVAKHRLAILDPLNQYSEQHPEVVNLVAQFDQGRRRASRIVKKCVHLVSTFVKGFKNLGALEGCLAHKRDKHPQNFMFFLRRGILPRFVSMAGHIVPLLGLVELLAAARFLCDTDVLGGRADNAGYVVERDIGGVPLAVRVVKIDPGESFNFMADACQFDQSLRISPSRASLKNKKDFQWANNQPLQVKWEKLSKKQQQDALAIFEKGRELIRREGFLKFLIKREGLFDKAREGGKKLVTNKIFLDLQDKWQYYIALHERKDVYGPLNAKHANTLEPSASFNPKYFDAANYSMDQVDEALGKGHEVSGGGYKL